MCSGAAIARISLLNMNFMLKQCLKCILLLDVIMPSDNLIVAEVNADEDKDLAQRFEIRGYPTLKFFPAGESQEPIVFKGERSAAGLVEWTNEKLGIVFP